MSDLYAGYADQAALDAAYDVERSVADFAAHAETFVRDSEAAEHALPDKRLGIAYGPTLMENLDLYTPAPGPDAAPVLVFVHGGYWKSLTSRVFSCVASGPVAAGMCVVNVTYDLCPQVEIGEIVRQVRAAVAWAARHAESFGGDPRRLVVAGHSAGGHLTASALLTDWSRYGLPRDTIRGALAISGLYDLEPLSLSFLQSALRLTAETVRRHSPQRNVAAVEAPLALAWGDADPEAFARQSMDFEAAWRGAGNRCSSFVLPGANHFEVLESFKTADGVMTRAVLDLAEGRLPAA